MNVLMLIVFGIGLISSIAAYMNQLIRKRHEQFLELSNWLGLQLVAPKKTFGQTINLSIEGRWKGRDIRITSHEKKAGKSSTTHTDVELSVTNFLGYTLDVSLENALTRMGKAIGFKDFQVGSPPFDDTFRITGNDEYFAQTVFDEQLTAMFNDMKGELKGTLSLKGGKLSYSEATDITTSSARQRYQRIILLMRATVEKIEEKFEKPRQNRMAGLDTADDPLLDLNQKTKSVQRPTAPPPAQDDSPYKDLLGM